MPFMMFVLNITNLEKWNSNMEIKEADYFTTETKYRLTLEHEGVTYYWHGFQGDFGVMEYWYNSDGNIISEPDWADELDSLDTFFDLCIEKAEQKVKS